MDIYRALAESVDDILKPVGFKRQRLTWSKRETDCVTVLQVQKTSWPRPSEACFTLNVGVCFDEVHAIRWGEKPPNQISIGRCYPNFRIGELIAPSFKEARDVWWTIKAGDEPDDFLNDVSTKIRRNVLPYFQDTTEIGDALKTERQRSYLTFDDQIHLAIMLHLSGYHSRANEIFAKVSQSSEPWKSAVDLIVSRLVETDFTELDIG